MKILIIKSPWLTPKTVKNIMHVCIRYVLIDVMSIIGRQLAHALLHTSANDMYNKINLSGNMFRPHLDLTFEKLSQYSERKTYVA